MILKDFQGFTVIVLNTTALYKVCKVSTNYIRPSFLERHKAEIALDETIFACLTLSVILEQPFHKGKSGVELHSALVLRSDNSISGLRVHYMIRIPTCALCQDSMWMNLLGNGNLCSCVADAIHSWHSFFWISFFFPAWDYE